MKRWQSSALLGLACLVLPLRALALPMPGSVAGQALSFTISETAEAQEPGTQEFFHFTFNNIPNNGFFESGSLLLCEPGTNCDPGDQSNTNWSDVIQWGGGNLVDLISDPAMFPDLTFPFGVGTEVRTEVALLGGLGVVYQANDGNGNITSWTILSDVPEPVPEPASLLLVGSGILLLGCNRRFRRA